MSVASISERSPASVGVLQIISSNPGIKTADIQKLGGWSMFHTRTSLRYLRNQGRVKSKRIGNRYCMWWTV